MSLQVHLYFSLWRNESRAWRNGTTAIEHGYATKAVYVGYKGQDLPNEEILKPGHTIMRVGAEPAPPGASRILRALSLPRWWRACLNKIPMQDASMVVAHSLAALPVGVWLARRHKLPLLYDAHELESERNGWRKPIRMIARFIEARYIHKAHHTTVVSKTIEEWYADAFKLRSLSTVRNVPVKHTADGESRLRETLCIPKDALVFIYCGVIGPGRTHSELIEAFRAFGDDRHIVFLGSDGGEWDALEKQSADVPNVHLHPSVPQSELVTLMSGGDVGLSLLNPTSLSYFYALPNKLFEYAAAGLAVCVGPGEEVRRFAANYPLGKTTDLTVEGLRTVAQSWTRAEIDAAQDAINAYEPPNWQEEQYHLLDAFDAAIRNSGGTPPERPNPTQATPASDA